MAPGLFCQVCLEESSSVGHLKNHLRSKSHQQTLLQGKLACLTSADHSVSHAVFKSVALDESITIFTLKARLQKKAQLFQKAVYHGQVHLKSIFLESRPKYPKLGLSLVTLCVGSKIGSLFYLCHACEDSVFDISKHLDSAEHCRNYYNYTNPDVLRFSWIPSTKIHTMVDPVVHGNIKKNWEQHTGRLQVLDLPPVLWETVKSCSYVNAMATLSQNDNLLKQISAARPKRMTIQTYLGTPKKHSLLGLEHLVECSCEDQTDRRLYLCTVCKRTFTNAKIINHLLGFHHIRCYINAWHPSTLLLNSYSYTATFNVMMRDLAKQMEEIHGTTITDMKQLVLRPDMFSSLEGSSYIEALNMLEHWRKLRKESSLMTTSVIPGDKLVHAPGKMTTSNASKDPVPVKEAATEKKEPAKSSDAETVHVPGESTPSSSTSPDPVSVKGGDVAKEKEGTEQPSNAATSEAKQPTAEPPGGEMTAHHPTKKVAPTTVAKLEEAKRPVMACVLCCQVCCMKFRNITKYVQHVKRWEHVQEMKRIFDTEAEEMEYKPVFHCEILHEYFYIKNGQRAEPVIGLPHIVTCVSTRATIQAFCVCLVCKWLFPATAYEFRAHLRSPIHIQQTLMHQNPARLPFAWREQEPTCFLTSWAWEEERAQGPDHMVLKMIDLPSRILSMLCNSSPHDCFQTVCETLDRNFLNGWIHEVPKIVTIKALQETISSDKYPQLGVQFLVRHISGLGPWRSLCFICERNLEELEFCSHAFSMEHVKKFLTKAHPGSLDCEAKRTPDMLLDFAKQAAEIHLNSPHSHCIQKVRVSGPICPYSYKTAVKALKWQKKMEGGKLFTGLPVGKKLVPTEAPKETDNNVSSNTSPEMTKTAERDAATLQPPDVKDPTPQPPDVKDPTPLRPDVKDPTPLRPDVKDPTPLRPDVKDPTPLRPDVKDPTPLRPDVKDPTPQPPDVKDPTPQPPDVKDPTPLRPDVKDPTPQPPDVKDPTPQHPDVKDPTPQPPDVKDPTPQPPDVKDPTPLRPDVKDPTPQHPDVKDPTPLRPDVKDPTPLRPDVKDPTPLRPDVKDPTPLRPDVKDPTPLRPDVKDPTPLRPDVKDPTPLRPDVKDPTPQPPDVKDPIPQPPPPDVKDPTPQPPDVKDPTPPDVKDPTPQHPDVKDLASQHPQPVPVEQEAASEKDSRVHKPDEKKRPTQNTSVERRADAATSVDRDTLKQRREEQRSAVKSTTGRRLSSESQDKPPDVKDPTPQPPDVKDPTPPDVKDPTPQRPDVKDLASQHPQPVPVEQEAASEKDSCVHKPDEKKRPTQNTSVERRADAGTSVDRDTLKQRKEEQSSAVKSTTGRRLSSESQDKDKAQKRKHDAVEEAETERGATTSEDTTTPRVGGGFDVEKENGAPEKKRRSETAVITPEADGERQRPDDAESRSACEKIQTTREEGDASRVDQTAEALGDVAAETNAHEQRVTHKALRKEIELVAVQDTLHGAPQPADSPAVSEVTHNIQVSPTHPQGLQTPPSTSDCQPRPNPLISDVQDKTSSSDLPQVTPEDIMDPAVTNTTLWSFLNYPTRTEPVIGLSMVKQFSASVHFHCHCCSMSRSNILFHIKSARHRYNYIKKVHPHMIHEWPRMVGQWWGVRHWVTKLRDLARQLEREEGWGRLEVLDYVHGVPQPEDSPAVSEVTHNIQVSPTHPQGLQTPPSTSDCQPRPSPLISDVQDKDLQQPQVEPPTDGFTLQLTPEDITATDPALWRFLNSTERTEPVIGLSMMTEFQWPTEQSARNYFRCHCCSRDMVGSQHMAHILSAEHRYNYIKRLRPNMVHDWPSSVDPNGRPGELRDLAQQVEREEGWGKLRVTEVRSSTSRSLKATAKDKELVAEQDTLDEQPNTPPQPVSEVTHNIQVSPTHPQSLHTPPSTSDCQPRPSPLISAVQDKDLQQPQVEAPTDRCHLQVTPEDIMELIIPAIKKTALWKHCKGTKGTEPVIGLSMMKKLSAKHYTSIHFLCQCCSIGFPRSDLFSHVTSAKHRYNYLKKVHPHLIHDWPIRVKLHKRHWAIKLRNLAQQLVKDEGIFQVLDYVHGVPQPADAPAVSEVTHNIQVSPTHPQGLQTPPSTSDCQPRPSPLISDVQDKDLQQPQVETPTDSCHLQVTTELAQQLVKDEGRFQVLDTLQRVPQPEDAPAVSEVIHNIQVSPTHPQGLQTPPSTSDCQPRPSPLISDVQDKDLQQPQVEPPTEGCHLQVTPEDIVDPAIKNTALWKYRKGTNGTEPLIGLSMVKKSSAMHSTVFRFLCQCCSSDFPRSGLFSHVTSAKHRYKFIKKVHPHLIHDWPISVSLNKKQEWVGKLRDLAQQLVKDEVPVPQPEDAPAVSEVIHKIQVSPTHPQGLQTPPSTSDCQPRPSPLISDVQDKDLQQPQVEPPTDSCHLQVTPEDIIDPAVTVETMQWRRKYGDDIKGAEPEIGLSMIKRLEQKKLSAKHSTSIHFHCQCCSRDFPRSDLYTHVTSAKHRYHYIEKEHPHLIYGWPKLMNPKRDWARKLRDLAQQLASNEGRLLVPDTSHGVPQPEDALVVSEVIHNLQVSITHPQGLQTPPSTSDCQPRPSPLISDVQDKDLQVTPEDPAATNPYLWYNLNSPKRVQPVIGLSKMTEYRWPEWPARNYFRCHCCCVNFRSAEHMSHITSAEHRYNYIKEARPRMLDGYGWPSLERKPTQFQTEVLRDLAHLVEKDEGWGRLRVEMGSTSQEATDESHMTADGTSNTTDVNEHTFLNVISKSLAELTELASSCLTEDTAQAVSKGNVVTATSHTDGETTTTSDALATNSKLELGSKSTATISKPSASTGGASLATCASEKPATTPSSPNVAHACSTAAKPKSNVASKAKASEAATKQQIGTNSNVIGTNSKLEPGSKSTAASSRSAAPSHAATISSATSTISNSAGAEAHVTQTTTSATPTTSRTTANSKPIAQLSSATPAVSESTTPVAKSTTSTTTSKPSPTVCHTDIAMRKPSAETFSNTTPTISKPTTSMGVAKPVSASDKPATTNFSPTVMASKTSQSTSKSATNQQVTKTSNSKLANSSKMTATTSKPVVLSASDKPATTSTLTVTGVRDTADTPKNEVDLNTSESTSKCATNQQHTTIPNSKLAIGSKTTAPTSKSVAASHAATISSATSSKSAGNQNSSSETPTPSRATANSKPIAHISSATPAKSKSTATISKSTASTTTSKPSATVCHSTTVMSKPTATLSNTTPTTSKPAKPMGVASKRVSASKSVTWACDNPKNEVASKTSELTSKHVTNQQVATTSDVLAANSKLATSSKFTATTSSISKSTGIKSHQTQTTSSATPVRYMTDIANPVMSWKMSTKHLVPETSVTAIRTNTTLTTCQTAKAVSKTGHMQTSMMANGDDATPPVSKSSTTISKPTTSMITSKPSTCPEIPDSQEALWEAMDAALLTGAASEAPRVSGKASTMSSATPTVSTTTAKSKPTAHVSSATPATSESAATVSKRTTSTATSRPSTTVCHSATAMSKPTAATLSNTTPTMSIPITSMGVASKAMSASDKPAATTSIPTVTEACGTAAKNQVASKTTESTSKSATSQQVTTTSDVLAANSKLAISSKTTVTTSKPAAPYRAAAVSGATSALSDSTGAVSHLSQTTSGATSAVSRTTANSKPTAHFSSVTPAKSKAIATTSEPSATVCPSATVTSKPTATVSNTTLSTSTATISRPSPSHAPGKEATTFSPTVPRTCDAAGGKNEVVSKTSETALRTATNQQVTETSVTATKTRSASTTCHTNEDWSTMGPLQAYARSNSVDATLKRDTQGLLSLFTAVSPASTCGSSPSETSECSRRSESITYGPVVGVRFMVSVTHEKRSTLFCTLCKTKPNSNRQHRSNPMHQLNYVRIKFPELTSLSDTELLTLVPDLAKQDAVNSHVIQTVTMNSEREYEELTKAELPEALAMLEAILLRQQRGSQDSPSAANSQPESLKHQDMFPSTDGVETTQRPHRLATGSQSSPLHTLPPADAQPGGPQSRDVQPESSRYPRTQPVTLRDTRTQPAAPWDSVEQQGGPRGSPGRQEAPQEPATWQKAPQDSSGVSSAKARGMAAAYPCHTQLTPLQDCDTRPVAPQCSGASQKAPQDPGGVQLKDPEPREGRRIKLEETRMPLERPLRQTFFLDSDRGRHQQPPVLQGTSAEKSKLTSIFLGVRLSEAEWKKVIGLAWVLECQCRDIYTGEQLFPFYLCRICEEKVQLKQIIGHVTNIHHQRAHMAYCSTIAAGIEEVKASEEDKNKMFERAVNKVSERERGVQTDAMVIKLTKEEYNRVQAAPFNEGIHILEDILVPSSCPPADQHPPEATDNRRLKKQGLTEKTPISVAIVKTEPIPECLTIPDAHDSNTAVTIKQEVKQEDHAHSCFSGHAEMRKPLKHGLDGVSLIGDAGTVKRRRMSKSAAGSDTRDSPSSLCLKVSSRVSLSPSPQNQETSVKVEPSQCPSLQNQETSVKVEPSQCPSLQNQETSVKVEPCQCPSLQKQEATVKAEPTSVPTTVVSQLVQCCEALQMQPERKLELVLNSLKTIASFNNFNLECPPTNPASAASTETWFTVSSLARREPRPELRSILSEVDGASLARRESQPDRRSAPPNPSDAERASPPLVLSHVTPVPLSPPADREPSSSEPITSIVDVNNFRHFASLARAKQSGKDVYSGQESSENAIVGRVKPRMQSGSECQIPVAKRNQNVNVRKRAAPEPPGVDVWSYENRQFPVVAGDERPLESYYGAARPAGGGGRVTSNSATATEEPDLPGVVAQLYRNLGIGVGGASATPPPATVVNPNAERRITRTYNTMASPFNVAVGPYMGGPVTAVNPNPTSQQFAAIDYSVNQPTVPMAPAGGSMPAAGYPGTPLYQYRQVAQNPYFAHGHPSVAGTQSTYFTHGYPSATGTQNSYLAAHGYPYGTGPVVLPPPAHLQQHNPPAAAAGVSQAPDQHSVFSPYVSYSGGSTGGLYPVHTPAQQGAVAGQSVMSGGSYTTNPPLEAWLDMQMQQPQPQ